MAPPRNYNDDKEKIRAFLTTFYISHETENGHEKIFTYDVNIADLADREQVSLQISMDDVAMEDPELAEAIIGNARRYQALFAEVVDELIQEKLKNKEPPVKDALDAFIYQRLLMAREAATWATREGGAVPIETEIRRRYPPQLMRRVEVYFAPGSGEAWKGQSVREVKAEHIGKLLTLRGLVIRATEVSPQASVITYTCDTCGAETYQPVTGPSFKPPHACPSVDCVQNKANGRLLMQVRGSKFVKFQEIKIQEHSEQMPVGSIPRVVSILVQGENTRLCVPGDSVRVTGIFLPHLKSGFRPMSSGLVSEVFIEAQHIDVVSRSGDGADENESCALTEAEIEIAAESNFYDRLASSIAPEIFGHLDIKKTLMLQLVGGVDRNAVGMKIRGAVNICLMGDPGVAKSQLLGWINRLSPRSQYTTGRGSSGVGLTASVAKDPVTGEWALEGGALVLADKGICCIDEFDKMPENDRTAIHEVMEQQTISIAKAGIMTTLNARVAILAAANPAYGRYNPRKTVEQNIQLPAALLSRFDVLWLIQDKPDREYDLDLARHITYVHAHAKKPLRRQAGTPEPLSMDFIRRYAQFCKRTQPQVPEALTGSLVEFYVELRKDARANKASSTFTSARSVLGALRLSTALARLHLRTTVTQEDIAEACRLLGSSKSSLAPGLVQGKQTENPTDRAWDVLRQMLRDLPDDAPHEIDAKDARLKIIGKGMDEKIFDHCVAVYSHAGVISMNRARTKIIFTE